MRRSSVRTARRQHGFTYLWVLVGVAALGLGLVRAAEVVSMADQRGNERVLLAIGNEFREALRRYHDVALVDGSHQYPLTLEQLLADDRDGSVRRHLRKIHTDPMTGKADWGLVRVDGRIVGVHSLSAKAAIKRDNFSDLDRDLIGKAMVGQWVFAHASR